MTPNKEVEELKHKIRILDKKLEHSRSREARLCGDHQGKNYTGENCILCEYERRSQHTKSKLVELDEFNVEIFMRQFKALYVGSDDFYELNLSQALCSRFGTKRVDVEKIKDIVDKELSIHKYTEQVSRRDVANAIVKELEG